ncbi:MAG: transglycosylase SLT domain-containing protein, partial [Gammaproteobacteria bacterium]
MRASALCAILVAGSLVTTPGLVAATPAKPDPRLRLLLKQAIADHSSFKDKYEAEVWLVDMSHRLAGRIPNAKHRLDLLKEVHAEARRAHLPPELVLAVIDVESGFDRFAISESGAQGLMQVMPFWLKEI